MASGQFLEKDFRNGLKKLKWVLFIISILKCGNILGGRILIKPEKET